MRTTILLLFICSLSFGQYPVNDGFVESTDDGYVKGVGGSGLSTALKAKFLFIGNYSAITGGKMPNTLDTSTLIVAGSAGSETYKLRNITANVNADTTDWIWFKTNASQRAVTTAELIGYDFKRTLINYDYSTPNQIRTIGILKAGETYSTAQRDELFTYFKLSVLWNDTLNDNGIVKDNRGLGRSVWTPESFIPTGVTLTLISGGVKIDWTDNSGGTSQTEIWGKSDAGTYALLYTIDAGTVTKNDDAVTPVDLRYYKLRSKYGTIYSDYSTEASIAMLGSELATGWAPAAFWNVEFPANWTSDNTKLSCAGAARIRRGLFFEINAKYRTITTVTGTGNFRPPHFATGNQVERAAPGTYTEYVTVTGATLAIVSSTFVGDVTALSIKKILAP